MSRTKSGRAVNCRCLSGCKKGLAHQRGNGAMSWNAGNKRQGEAANPKCFFRVMRVVLCDTSNTTNNAIQVPGEARTLPDRSEDRLSARPVAPYPSALQDSLKPSTGDDARPLQTVLW